MKLVTIDSTAQLYDEALNIAFNDKPIQHYFISKKMNIGLKLQGETWSGQIDYRMAQFVIKVQNEIFKAYEASSGIRVDLRSQKTLISPLTVKFQIIEGSLWTDLKLDKVIQEMVSNMESKHKFWLCAIAIGALFAYLTVGQLVDYKKDIAKYARDDKQVTEWQKTTADALYTLRSSQSSMDHLVRHMAKDDRLEIPSHNRTLTKQEIKDHLPPSVDKSPIEKSIWVDDNFEVAILNFDKQIIRLRHGDISFDAVTVAMRDADKVKLYRLIEKAIKEQKVQNLDLQLTMQFVDEIIGVCSITGIGAKRDDAKSLAQVMAKGNDVDVVD